MDTGVDLKSAPTHICTTDLTKVQGLLQQLVAVTSQAPPSASSTVSGSGLMEEAFVSTSKPIGDVLPSKSHLGRWIGGVLTVLISLVGSIYAWSGSLVTHDALDRKIAPIEQKLENQVDQLNNVQEGVSKLLSRTERQDKINEARRLVDKHTRSYQAQLEEYASASNKRNRQKPRKSAALIDAEAKLETLLEAQ